MNRKKENIISNKLFHQSDETYFCRFVSERQAARTLERPGSKGTRCIKSGPIQLQQRARVKTAIGVTVTEPTLEGRTRFVRFFFSLLPSLNILVSFWPVREINPQKIGRLIQLARRLVCGWEVFRPFSVDSVSVMVRPKERKTKEIPLRGTLVGLGSLLPTTATAQQPDDDDADGM